jgi:HSP20 family protein
MNLIKRNVTKPKRMIRNYQPTYSPFKDLFSLMDFNYDNLFDYGRQSSYYYPRLNMRDDGEQYVIEIDVAGYSEDQLNVSIDGDQLTISGKYSNDYEDKGVKYLVREMNYGTFTRTVSLPKEAYTDETYAQLEHGVLSLYVPKANGAAAPKQIEIKTVE